MLQVPLFSTNISIIDIDASSWDKSSLVSDIEYNYKLSNYRNKWNDNSNLHHYFNDWDNNDYKKLNFDQLISIYDKEIKKFMTSVADSEKIFKWKWNIVNVTAYDNDQHMQIHDHLLGKTMYSAVHYISIPSNYSTINFINPLIALQYAHPTIEIISKCINNQDFKNSNFFSDWDLNVKEDTLVIFPSYLKHQVKPNKNNEVLHKLRIGVVLNIDIDED